MRVRHHPAGFARLHLTRSRLRWLSLADLAGRMAQRIAENDQKLVQGALPEVF